MSDTGKRMNRLFAVTFAIVMFAFVVVAAWFCVVERQAAITAEDVQISLDTSRGRENKQNSEYATVSEELPATQALLDGTQPLAEAALATVTDLKAERKALRTANSDLEAAIQAANTEAETLNAEAEALQLTIAQLTAEAEALEAQLASMQSDADLAAALDTEVTALEEQASMLEQQLQQLKNP